MSLFLRECLLNIENCLMRKHEDYIGKTFTTQKGGILTVKERITKVSSKGNKIMPYICECSICSLDEELWPYGSIVSHRATLNGGGTSCGCAGSIKWTEYQTRIRVSRLADDLGYIFYGWYGEYNGNKTYLDLYNPVTDNRWISTCVDKFFSGRYDPVLGNQRSVDASRKVWVGLQQETLRGGIATVIEDLKTDGIKVHCTECEKDPELFGDGTFTLIKDVWSRGDIICGCSLRYAYSPEQKLILYNRKGFENNEGLYVYHEDGWKISRRCLRCNRIWSGCYHNAMIGKDCSECSESGYKRDKPANFYIVKWLDPISNNPILIKFGITNNDVRSRVYNQALKTELIPEVLYTYNYEDGAFVESIEKDLKVIMKQDLCVPKEIFKDGYTECFYYNEDSINFVKNFVENKLNVK